MMLPISPQVLHRIKLWRIGWKKLKLQPIVLPKDKVLDQPAAMTSKPIPDHQDLAPNMAQQVPQKLDHLGTSNRPWKQTEVKIIPGHASHSRELLPIEMVLQNRSLPPRRPCPTNMRLLAQTAFVDKHYGSAFPLGFFLSLGQRFFFHHWIFASSRSKALFAGLWQLQPNCCKIRQTWAGWYFTPHCCSINSPTRAVVHSSVSYPNACGPRVSLCSTRFRSASLSKGFRPARPAFLSPFTPEVLSVFSQRLTD